MNIGSFQIRNESAEADKSVRDRKMAGIVLNFEN